MWLNKEKNRKLLRIKFGSKPVYSDDEKHKNKNKNICW